MPEFHRDADGDLWIEGTPAGDIASAVGTPTYVYSRAAIESAFAAFTGAFAGHPHLVCYAVKANSNLGVLSLFARLGAAFDIVSVGELERVLRAGGEPGKIVFSGVGKQRHELVRALEVGIACFNVESTAELDLLSATARDLGVTAPMSLRVNPDVDAGTHPYIATGLRENKFGVSIDDALDLYRRAAADPHLAAIGVDCHIGSQITELSPFGEAVSRVVELVDQLSCEGITLEHIDLGGGLGVRYRDETPIDVATYAGVILQGLGAHAHTLLFEPGRWLVANAGILLTEVISLKANEGNHFAVVDAAMNDLLRPSLYSAWQDIQVARSSSSAAPRVEAEWDVVGPICESGDFLGKQRQLTLAPGDLLAVSSAGAYGFVMSSNYNSRGRAAEVIVSTLR